VSALGDEDAEAQFLTTTIARPLLSSGRSI